MKNISVENCLNIVPNKFNLALLVANRAKDILAGSPTKLDYDVSDDKASYIALKEYEENKLDTKEEVKKLKEEILKDNLFIKTSSNKKDLLKNDLSSEEDEDFNLDELMDSMEFEEDDDSFDDLNSTDVDDSETDEDL